MNPFVVFLWWVAFNGACLALMVRLGERVGEKFPWEKIARDVPPGLEWVFGLAVLILLALGLGVAALVAILAVIGYCAAHSAYTDVTIAYRMWRRCRATPGGSFRLTYREYRRKVRELEAQG
jgi:hypothetical protein